MADGNRRVDVCIVCAKADEAQAVVKEFSSRCRVSYNRDFIKSDNNYKYQYDYMEIKNEKKEVLTVLVTCLAYQGLVQTASFVTFLLNTFHPRFAAMTGYCAGDKTELSLGDLVVAEAAYHYEEGKVKEIEDGQKLHVPLIRPKEPAVNILQYVNRFELWKKPVGEIKPPENLDSLADSNQVKCHTGYIASGMAVRRDNPFKELRRHNHKTIALEMEAAAFYEAASSFSDIYSLVVKGVCDYADMNKHDTYHEYAARVSAIYLLYFIQEYVTDITMPRRDKTRSRRQLLVGLIGLVITGSGIAWFELSQQSKAPSAIHTPVSLGSLLYTYPGHSDWVTAVTWSPDSKSIASASADKTVQVWDARDGGHTYKYPGHGDIVYAVAWSPDGTRIASGSSDGTAQIWDPADDGRRISTYHGHANAELGVQSLAWSPDGTRIASAGSDGTVQVWYAADGGQISTHTGHAYGENALAWSPHDGKYIAFGSSDTTVQVWNAMDGTLVNTYRGHSNLVHTVAWSPDGKYIASGSRDHTVQVWKAVDSTLINIDHGHTFWVEAVVWSPDGKRIVSGSWDTTVRVWDAANGKQVYLYTKYSDPVNAVAWSPDGTLIASGGGFPGRGKVQVWGAG